MNSAQYKYILRDAWNITIRNKVLWIWGIFASLISFEGIYETVGTQFAQFRQPEIFYVQLINSYQSQLSQVGDNVQFLNILGGNISIFIVAIVVTALIFTGLWFVMVSQIVLIESAAGLYRKTKTNLTELFHSAADHFWPVLGINMLARLAVYLAFILLSLPLIFSLSTSVSPAIFLANILFFTLFVVLSVIIGFLSVYAINYIVIDGVHFSEAIGKAWDLFKKNKVLSLEVALMLFITKVLSVIFIFALGFIIGTPLIAFILLSLVNNSAIGVGLGVILLVLLIAGVVLLVNTVFTVFYLSAWTITFIEMTKNNVLSKFHRLVQKLTGRIVSKSKRYIDSIDREKLEARVRPYAERALHEAKREARVAHRVIREKYIELEPVVKKEIKKIVQEAKKRAAEELTRQKKALQQRNTGRKATTAASKSKKTRSGSASRSVKKTKNATKKRRS